MTRKAKKTFYITTLLITRIRYIYWIHFLLSEGTCYTLQMRYMRGKISQLKNHINIKRLIQSSIRLISFRKLIISKKSSISKNKRMFQISHFMMIRILWSKDFTFLSLKILSFKLWSRNSQELCIVRNLIWISLFKKKI
jgi:hypothetical protein